MRADESSYWQDWYNIAAKDLERDDLLNHVHLASEMIELLKEQTRER